MGKHIVTSWMIFLFIVLVCSKAPVAAQSVMSKIAADKKLKHIEAIESREDRLDTLKSLFDFYKNSNDSFIYAVLDIMKSTATKYKDNSYWAWYYYERSFLEGTLGGNLFLQTIDSSYTKAKSIGDNELIVRVLSIKTMYLFRNKRYHVALETSIEALNLSEANHFKHFLPYRYLTTSGIYGSLGDSARQYAMALKACEAANCLNDLEAKAYCHEALANIIAEKKDYVQAIKLLQLSVHWFDKLGLQNNVAGSHLRMANVYLMMQQPYTAKQYANLALNHFFGIRNTGLTKDANEILAQIYEELNMPDSAIYFYNACIAIGTFNNNPFGNVTFHKALADIYLGKKDYEKAVENLQLYTLLHDSIINIEKNRAIEETSVKYETEKKDKDIILLNKDKDLKEQLLSRQKLLRNTLIGGIVLLLLLGILFFNRIQLRKKIDQHKAITNERERIITDLHDDIGATLSSMNIYGDLAGNVWESRPQDSRKMIEKISSTSKDLMSRMGDIIWSMKPADEEKYTLESRLKNYSNELLSPKNIECDFDIDGKLAASITNPEVRKNILLIAKEAINNIAKYSEASKATVSFRQQKEFVLLTIIDNGKGYSVENIKPGNGLQNIQHRCKQFNGTCSVESTLGAGVSMVCSFPIATISHTV